MHTSPCFRRKLPRLLACLGLFFLAAAVPLAADDSGTLAMSWPAVKGASGYLVEVRTQSGKKLIASEEVKEASVSLELPPGVYEIRITTINRFGGREGASNWVPVTVIRKLVPVIKSFSPRQVTTKRDFRLVITGSNFYPDTQVWLELDGRKIRPRKRESIEGERMVLSFTALAKPGALDLVVSNGTGKLVRRRAALALVEPPPPVASTPAKPATTKPSQVAPANAPVTAPAAPVFDTSPNFGLIPAWGLSLPLGAWSQVYELAPVDAQILAGIRLPVDGLDLYLDLGMATWYTDNRASNEGSGTVTSEFFALSLNAGPRLLLELAPNLAMNLRLLTGLEYRSLHVLNPLPGDQADYYSLGSFVQAGIGLELWVDRSLGIGIEGKYQLRFLPGEMLHTISPGLYTVINLDA